MSGLPTAPSFGVLFLSAMETTIYLPTENTVNVDMVIRHELIHLKRKDLWVKAFTLGASALHWFNPLVHILRKDIHIWSELSCDEEVVKEMSHAERKRYGETILSVMAGSRNLPVQFCASLSGDGKQLKRRLMMMLNVKKQKKTMYLTITAVFWLRISTSSRHGLLTIRPKSLEMRRVMLKLNHKRPLGRYLLKPSLRMKETML